MGIPKKADYKFTYQDYCSWPDDERWEIIDGIAYDMSPAPPRRHQGILGKIFFEFSNYFEKKTCVVYIGPLDVFFPKQQSQDMNTVTTVVQPDISIICDKNKLIDQGCFGAPDLVVEILFPSTCKKDLDEKFHLYENHGVKEYWIVDPGNKYIQIFTQTENKKFNEGILLEKSGIAKSTIFEALSINLNTLFTEN